jgi:hypothetical protein
MAWMNLHSVVETEMILLAVPTDMSIVTGSVEAQELVGDAALFFYFVEKPVLL